MKTIKIDHDTHTFVYNGVTGEYLGQFQDNALGDSLYDLNSIWLPAEIIDGKPCVNGQPVPPLEPHELREHHIERHRCLDVDNYGDHPMLEEDMGA